MDLLRTYIQQLNQTYQSGVATEHSYRGYLQTLVECLCPGILATNEPKRQKCGAPDYILMRNEIPVGYIEAKDIGDRDLDGKKAKGGHKEQFDRYKHDLSNLIFTDYINFKFYRNGECYASCQIAELQNNEITALTDSFDHFTALIKDFVQQHPMTIKSSAKLADMMATKARLLGDIIEKAILNDVEADETSSLFEQMKTFKHLLIHDVTPKSFANVYAQTVAFGLFAARLHDPTLEDFSRQEAAELIPKTNPFLRGLFGYIAGPDIDQRILWVVNELVDIFLVTNIRDILKDYGADTQTQDPIVHFYETFLSIYDAKERKDRGVWYTPKPVVRFIVHAIDEILKKHFHLHDGLKDTSTVETISGQGKSKITKTVPRVQILDPATGTGTFLAETLKFLHKTFKYNQGMWSNYVENHLLDRLYGFEILMASYTLAHIKCELLLRQTGYVPKQDKRFNIYLTNTLEKYNEDAGTLFSAWLSVEARKADLIKRDAPVMVVMGNPPYSGENANKGVWTKELIEPYKLEPFSEQKLQEKNPKWLNDDYVKFLRYAQTLIDRNQSGVVAFINNHSFLDNPTFRGMRYSLLQSFDYIYILDLHGNAKKSEKCADGSADENVFNIQQGVCINLFVKISNTRSAKEKPNKSKKDNSNAEIKCKVYYAEIKGKREQKYDILCRFSSIPEYETNADDELDSFYNFNFDNDPNIINVVRDLSVEIEESIDSRACDSGVCDSGACPTVSNDGVPNKGIRWTEVQMDKKMCYFVPKVFENQNEYESYIGIEQFLNTYSTGILTARDDFTIDTNRQNLVNRIQQFLTIDDETARVKFNLKRDVRDWKVCYARKDIENHNDYNDYITQIQYRLFDTRWTFYTGVNKGFMTNPRYDVMKHMLHDNYGLVLCRQVKSGAFYHVFVTNRITESSYLSNKTSEITSIFPLYLYPDALSFDTKSRKVNFNSEHLDQLLKFTGLTADDVISETGKVSPLTVFDYIYGILHSHKYRLQYSAQLMSDFPRIPAPSSLEYMLKIADLGKLLRQLHLMEIPIAPVHNFPVDGDNQVSNVKNFQFYRDDKIWLNDTQYFDNVSPEVWSSQIGCYQPADKYLKDRRGQTLNYVEIEHYQKILSVLAKTISLMNTLDEIVEL